MSLVDVRGASTSPVVAVTGAARGIGRAVAERLAASGRAVVLLDRDEAEGGALATELARGGAEVRFVACDVTDERSVAVAFSRVAERGRPLDGLVCNAGTNAYLDPLCASVGEWDAIFALNVRSAWLCARAAVPLMEGAGSIVNVASIHAARTVPGLFPYAATKSALVGLTRGLALELADRGVRVNAVCPGWTDTALMRSAIARQQDADAALAAVERRHPLGRIAEPAEIAAAIVYLLGPDASFVTGTELHVDGGLGALSPA